MSEPERPDVTDGGGARVSESVTRAALAGTFQGIGQDYDAYRPGFPERAVELIVPQQVGTALDLGAGTGKFTERLIGPADRVVAVEPSEQMLAVLRDKLPAVQALVGGAEAIPLPDATADVVTVAQAFHWFDREPACAEIARVLVPGGRLGLLWNTPDPDCAWDRACYEVAHPGLADDQAASEPDVPGFELLEREVVRWTEAITRGLYLRRWLTVSSFLAAEPARRAEMVAALERILDEDPETAGQEVLGLAQVTEVFVYSSR